MEAENQNSHSGGLTTHACSGEAFLAARGRVPWLTVVAGTKS